MARNTRYWTANSRTLEPGAHKAITAATVRGEVMKVRARFRTLVPRISPAHTKPNAITSGRCTWATAMGGT